MGAVTALYYMNKYKRLHKVKSLILDSPFADMNDVINQFC